MRSLLSLVWLASASAAFAQADDCSVRDPRVAANRVIALDPQAKDRIEGRRGELKSSSETAVWALDVKAATGVRIDVEGNDFDPAVELCREEGSRLVRVDENLDGPRSLNPQLDAFLAPGRWLIVVKSEALAGPFTLLVRQTDEKRLAEAAAQPIRAGETKRGSIKAEPDMSVTLKDRWRLPVEAGRSYLVTARSDRFDTILRVRDPAASTRAAPLAEDDDGWDRLNSALSFTAPRSGDVIIEIGDNNGRGGDYELAVRALEPPPANPPPLTDGTITFSMADACAPVAPGLPVAYKAFSVPVQHRQNVTIEAEGEGVSLHVVIDTPLGMRSILSSEQQGQPFRLRRSGPASVQLAPVTNGNLTLLVTTRYLPSPNEKVDVRITRRGP